MKLPSNLQNLLNNLPKSPGCYIYKDSQKNVLYVGKAINLNARVNSYFNNYKRLDPKIKLMIAQISFIEFILAENELEALLLETNLIKKYKPKYNRMMKDDKNYGWLMITTGDFPNIEYVREKKDKKAFYFGPFINPSQIKRILKDLRKIFPYRSCSRIITYKTSNDKKKVFYSSDKKPCLYYHLKLCQAPCAQLIISKEYKKNIRYIKQFLKLGALKLKEKLTKEMNLKADNLEFEKASMIRNQIQDLDYITQRIRVDQKMDELEFEKLKSFQSNSASKKLIYSLKKLNIKYLKNFRIECYDISNISGKDAVGSMIVFTNGKKDKSQYRKFKIKLIDSPDDFAMLEEVFTRRFSLKNKKMLGKYPDLIIVDGGKGQLSSTEKILKNNKINIPIVGLAKKNEEIFFLDKDEFKKIIFQKNSPQLFLIQQIRDEAHRFAINYHRKLHSKNQIYSKVSDIPGVGEVIYKRLLKAFGSYEGIRKAKKSDLINIVKNRRTVENISKLINQS